MLDASHQVVLSAGLLGAGLGINRLVFQKQLIIKAPFQSLGAGDGTRSSTVARKIPWTQEPGRLQSMGSHRVRHD